MNRILSIALLCCILIMSVVSDSYAEEVVLLLDNFESRRNINLLKGMAGAWEKDNTRTVEYCKTSFVPASRDGQPTSVLSLEYLLKLKSYNGYWTKLIGLDLRPYQYLFFYVKGSRKGYPERLRIELKSCYQSSNYTVKDITGSWQKVVIPLSEFKGPLVFEGWDQMSEFVITFEGEYIKTRRGEIYIDDIGFSSERDYYDRQMEVIEKEEQNKKQEMLRIAELPEDELLDYIARTTFNYFWIEASPHTGFVKDRSVLFAPSSVAATGFGLAAICIAKERKWVTEKEAYDRVLKILQALDTKAEGESGFFYHFINPHTGQRSGTSEVSTVDTALLLGGVLTARQSFSKRNIRKLCDKIFQSVRWSWMLGEEIEEEPPLYMGWKPETGFEGFIKWDMMAEELMMYLLALGSPSFPLEKGSWASFSRPVKTYGDYTYLYDECESMFIYTYSHAFVDFRNKHDMYTDYWENSRKAILANYQYCIDNGKKYKAYGEGYWGISASDGPLGYVGYGSKYGLNDGTLTPYSLCAALPFVPNKSIPTLRRLLKEYGNKVWGKYGFISAYNLDKDWFSIEHIGIDQGIILLMIENYRSGLIWKNFMKNPYIKKGLEVAGFEKGPYETNYDFLETVDNIRQMKKKSDQKETAKVMKTYTALKTTDRINIDGDLEEFGLLEMLDLKASLEWGEIVNDEDINISFGLRWDEEYLYFGIDIVDDKILAYQNPSEIYLEDVVELYLNPAGDTLIWGNEENFQIGFAPNSKLNKPVAWAWFQNGDTGDNIDMEVLTNDKGYVIEARIKWGFLKTQPEADKWLGMSVAVRDVDIAGNDGKKLNWSYQKLPTRVEIGKLMLAE